MLMKTTMYKDKFPNDPDIPFHVKWQQRFRANTCKFTAVNLLEEKLVWNTMWTLFLWNVIFSRKNLQEELLDLHENGYIRYHEFLPLSIQVTNGKA